MMMIIQQHYVNTQVDVWRSSFVLFHNFFFFFSASLKGQKQRERKQNIVI
jgi:hypothetical protein